MADTEAAVSAIYGSQIKNLREYVCGFQTIVTYLAIQKVLKG